MMVVVGQRGGSKQASYMRLFPRWQAKSESLWRRVLPSELFDVPQRSHLKTLQPRCSHHSL